MFFCDPCRKKLDWPESLFKSVGPCEVCGTRSVCNDVHAGSLPAEGGKSTKVAA